MDIAFFKKVINSAYANLENNKQMVNNLNVFPVPDGDTGTNMSLTCKTAVEEMNKNNSDDIASLTASLSGGALMGARGNSGVILSQLFRGFANGFSKNSEINVKTITKAFKSATEMAYRAVMKPTEGTILTVAREMSEFASENSDNYELDDITKFIEDVLKVGEKSLDNTPNLLPVLKEAGVVDSGGKGLLCLFEGALKSLKGADVILIRAGESEIVSSSVVDTQNISTADITFAYCTEFLIRVRPDNIDYEAPLREALRDKLEPLGDSLIVVGDNGIIKVHVHTNAPWNAMKISAACGELTKIKIENMKEQHTEVLLDEKEVISSAVEYSKEEKDYIFIAVTSGEGLGQILKNLGVDYIIKGGQTMNPSTKDFTDIIDNTNGKNYILLPNNKNIILAATQAVDISEKNVSLVRTKTIPEAISALIAFNESASIEENVEVMSGALKDVKTGNITFAVRDTKIKDKKIKKGDIMALNGDDIVLSTKDIKKAVNALVDDMVDEDSELLTLYFGEDVKREDAEKIAKKLEKKYPDIDIEVHNGGQPLYYYIVSVE